MMTAGFAGTLALWALTRFPAHAQPPAAAKAAAKWEYGVLSSGGREPGARWSTAAGTVEGEAWAKLAEALKGPDADKGTALVRVLNRLGDQGWELVAEHWPTERAPVSSWTFRRKAD